MRDEIDGRMWVEHHDAFSRSIAELFAAIKPGLARLHAIEWDAPWRRRGAGQA
jgi:hypothetical protein